MDGSERYIAGNWVTKQRGLSERHTKIIGSARGVATRPRQSFAAFPYIERQQIPLPQRPIASIPSLLFHSLLLPLGRQGNIKVDIEETRSKFYSVSIYPRARKTHLPCAEKFPFQGAELCLKDISHLTISSRLINIGQKTIIHRNISCNGVRCTQQKDGCHCW